MRVALMLAAVTAGAIALAGCGGDSTNDAVTTTETTATAPTTTTTTADTTTTTETTQTTPASEAKVIMVNVVKGVPKGGIQRPTVDKGDKVVLVVRTDSGEAVHLHGYNIEKDVVPGQAVRMPFTANIAGRFEVELHPTDALLAVVEVKP
jgi:ABC-type glycerol-3-phosphate transport system substrate-binding protein